MDSISDRSPQDDNRTIQEPYHAHIGIIPMNLPAKNRVYSHVYLQISHPIS